MVLLCERRSTNAWIPYFLKHNNDINNNVEETIRNVRGVLNKMTSKTFDVLLEDLKDLDIWDDKEALTEIATVIFEQAIISPLYVDLYADLCGHLRQAEKELSNGQNYFHAGLIRKVQFAFEGLLPNSNAESVDELREMKQKRDMIGILRFIAHLYRVKLLNFAIIENCYVIFIRGFDESKNELFLEYAIRFLFNVGPLIHDGEEKAKIYGFSCYCGRYKRDACKRIRFMIDDLKDLSERKWIKNV